LDRPARLSRCRGTSPPAAEPPVSEPSESEEFVEQPPRHWAVDLITRGTPVTVAVLDTGVDPNADRVSSRVIGGRNFTGEGSWGDGNGHGTHVAGIIAAHNPMAEVLAVKVLDRDGAGSLLSVAEGVIWAVDRGAKVLNLSLGVEPGIDASESALLAAIRYPHAKGVLVVTAAGNEGEYGSPENVPAIWDETLSVGALEGAYVASYSNRGPSLDIVAQGTDVSSSAVGGGDVTMSGTSMAAPVVASATAAVLSLNPEWSGIDAGRHLLATAVDFGAVGPDPVHGFGGLNVAAAVRTPGPLVPTGSVPTRAASELRVKSTLGGVTLHSSTHREVFVRDSNGGITVVDKDEPLFPLTKAGRHQIWSYDKHGAPTTVISRVLRPAKPPVLRASIDRRAGMTYLLVTSKLPQDSVLTVNTFTGRRKHSDVAVLNSNVRAIGFTGTHITAFEICFAVYLESIGCRKFTR
jgi:subtilisin family serine protease